MEEGRLHQTPGPVQNLDTHGTSSSSGLYFVCFHVPCRNLIAPGSWKFLAVPLISFGTQLTQRNWWKHDFNVYATAGTDHEEEDEDVEVVCEPEGAVDGAARVRDGEHEHDDEQQRQDHAREACNPFVAICSEESCFVDMRCIPRCSTRKIKLTRHSVPQPVVEFWKLVSSVKYNKIVTKQGNITEETAGKCCATVFTHAWK